MESIQIILPSTCTRKRDLKELRKGLIEIPFPENKKKLEALKQKYEEYRRRSQNPKKTFKEVFGIEDYEKHSPNKKKEILLEWEMDSKFAAAILERLFRKEDSLTSEEVEEIWKELKSNKEIENKLKEYQKLREESEEKWEYTGKVLFARRVGVLKDYIKGGELPSPTGFSYKEDYIFYFLPEEGRNEVIERK